MKKTITALFLSLIFSTSILHADQAQFVRNMAHANPVPNYMSIIKMNADKLGLNDEQKNKVMVWKKKNGPKMAAMVKSVIEGEKELKIASMDGVPQTEISAMSDKLLDTRKKIISGKTTCRDYMMDVLSDAQWKQLTDIIKAG
ncbi:MAG: hypothetical protein KZQ64_14435 [gamma proteobacterium symbiont of Bathyaustriella thionipta]|nr:hypothetical protein [gamma proteobacterium symbiont of Bathyaustriella thionipta]MCU7951433.1 hypothetical protein [gamma proteobacterium symbiont of Bathyaustriella thionipta]MCU7954568.1 hypothetical protein [gamma proteobacterium symbiont of Bathyaustriella thionipta]MCU7957985.1 hypothetical protein [gamma proteobacterium symbiont of Bathyaustriella thionipta]MCU7966809.1 hypothetical protein [gamma proteobacterium symbiont of Bathyaustriella thionipta]